MGGKWLHPTAQPPDDTPVQLLRLPWDVRRKLKIAGLITVGNVREAANETMLALKLNASVVDYIRATLGCHMTAA